jgi:DNA-binding NtrC family response regulator
MRTVLLVDDDDLVFEAVAEVLADWQGTRVNIARTGHTAAPMLRHLDFACALIDVELADMSGIALAEVAANEDVPVLLMSGDPDVTAYLERFDYPYLEKPLSLDLMLSEMKRLVADAQHNVRQVRASAARLRASGEALAAVTPLDDKSEALHEERGD